jgi:penicillin-binding protein 1C
LSLAQAIGVERCIGVIEAAGVRLAPDARAHAGLTLVTGGTPVTLVDLVTAYATLARGGEHVPTRLFADEQVAPSVRALSPATCEALFEILSNEARPPHVRGGASHVGVRPFMWKTGTSSGHVDAWAVGHDRRLALGVWVGRFDGAGHPSYVGAEVAEPILAELFVSPVLSGPLTEPRQRRSADQNVGLPCREARVVRGRAVRPTHGHVGDHGVSKAEREGQLVLER